MTKAIVDPALLFEFSISIHHFEHRDLDSWNLSEKYRLPHFASLNGQIHHSDVFAAWSEAGLFFQTAVFGKKQPPKFTRGEGGYSDGLRVWIDTRCSHGIQRGTRFCHCFQFFPGRPNRKSNTLATELPHGILDELPRYRERPLPIDAKKISVRSQFHRDGYSLWAFIPASCMTGYSPLEFDRIRLSCDVVDQELTTQSMVLGPELRYAENPSHWVEASLRSRR